MTNFIVIHTKPAYGNILAYPNCDKAKQFTKLTGKKTFSDADFDAIRALGYHIIDALDLDVLGLDACLEAAARNFPPSE